MDKLNDEIRLILNQWFKKQQRVVTVITKKDKGWLITKSQKAKLNKKIWQHIRDSSHNTGSGK